MRNKLTLPIDDPFWSKHRPGEQRKCPSQRLDLKGNPAKTKEIFSQDHPHFPNACATCHLNTDGKVHGVKGDKTAKDAAIKVKGNCDKCRIANNCLARIAEEGHSNTPPKLETYIEDTKGGNGVFYSPKHGEGELDGNLEIAHKLANHFNSNVYLLPRIDSNKPDAEQKYKELLPKGYPFVKEGKSPDYFIFGEFYEAKKAMDITYTDDEDAQKTKVENKIRKAKSQADNYVIELPEWVAQHAIYRATNSYFSRTSHGRTIIVIQGDLVKVYKNHRFQ